MHGRDLKLPVDTALDSLRKQVLPFTPHEVDLKRHLECLVQSREHAAEALAKVQRMSAERHSR